MIKGRAAQAGRSEKETAAQPDSEHGGMKTMSASREKRTRQEQREGGVEPIKRKREDRKEGRGKIIGSIIGAVLALVAIVVIIYGSGALHKGLPVLSVDGRSLNPAEFNFFFTGTKWNIYNMYAQYGIGFDTSQSLKSQEFGGGESWADYINEVTAESLTTMLVQCNEADREGVTLTQEDRDDLETTMQGWVEEAGNVNMSLQAYLDAAYGQGFTPDMLRRCMELQLLASRWETVKRESFDYTDEEIDAYYTENRTDFDRVTYESFTLNGVLSEGDDETKEAYYEAVKALADEMLGKVTTPDAFNALAVEYAARFDELAAEYAPEPEEEEVVDHDHDGDGVPDHDDDGHEAAAGDDETGDDQEAGEEEADEPEELNTRYTLTPYSKISNTEAADWLFDEARKSADKNSFEDSQSITVYSFIARERDDGPAHDVRHILALFNDSNSEPTEEEHAAALERAEEILKEWQDGEATEESFGELANEKSDDQGGQVTNGGIYEKLTTFTGFVEPFKEWYLDPARKPGDTDIIETTYGFHVMYYSKWHEVNAGWKEQAKESMTEENFNAYMDQAVEAARISKNFLGMFVTNVGK
jgi:hypothetical protein